MLIYQWLWYLVRFGLRFNDRMKVGYNQRILAENPPKADLWIQAASVGEAYLAWELVKKLQCARPTSILITTNTSQGFDILTEMSQKDFGPNKKIYSFYFPFDQPSLMDRALAAIQPKALVLLESELWPGLMSGCKTHNVKLLVINGRMTQRSLDSYLRWPTIWRDLRPHAILAMSEADGQRFAALFGNDIVGTMNNIKFDRLLFSPENSAKKDNPLQKIIAADAQFLVLGSVRREEEDDIAQLINYLYKSNDKFIIGLFPRHMHRLTHWQKKLRELKIPWSLRSQCTVKTPPGTVVLWDTMGELEMAYDLARTAFVGGSLAPVGGQNFLEPVSCGIRPAIGPHWTNFAWIGREIIDQGLVYEAQDWQEVAKYLLDNAQIQPDRLPLQKALQDFVRIRQGGTKIACQKIEEMAF